MDYVYGIFGSSSDPDRETRQNLSEAVTTTTATQGELRVTRQHMQNEMAEIWEEIQQAEQEGDVQTQNTKWDEYERKQAQLEQIDVFLGNTSITKDGLAQTALSVSVHDSQKTAAQALQQTTSQISQRDMIKTQQSLQSSIKQSERIAKTMGKPLKTRHETSLDKTREVNPKLRAKLEKSRKTTSVTKVVPPKHQETRQQQHMNSNLN